MKGINLSVEFINNHNTPASATKELCLLPGAYWNWWNIFIWWMKGINLSLNLLTIIIRQLELPSNKTKKIFIDLLVDNLDLLALITKELNLLLGVYWVSL